MELTMSKKKFSIIIGVVLLLISSSIFAHTSRLSWTPTELKPMSIAPGESVFIEVKLKASRFRRLRAVKQLQVVAKGEIAPYVSITQPDFPRPFKRGKEVTIGVTITAPDDMPLSVKTGKLVLKRVLPNGKVKRVWRAKKLPVELTFSAIPLPSDPGTAGKDTLLGIDTDENGVRDDIDRYIVFTHSDSAKVQEALKQEARELSVFLRDADSKELSRANALAEGASDCLSYVYDIYSSDDEAFETYVETKNLLISSFLNTKARSRAYNKADNWLGGMAFGDDEDEKSKCTFDPDTLPN
jgi:hypothetical protein